MKYYMQYIIALVAIMLSSCEEDVSFLAVKFNDAATAASEVTYYQATLSCQFERINDGYYDKNAHIYFEYADYPEYFQGTKRSGHYWESKSYSTNISNANKITVQVKDLSPSTRYYFAPVCKGDRNDELFRGTVHQFTTPATNAPRPNEFWLQEIHGTWNITSTKTKTGYNIFRSTGSYHVANEYDLLKVSFQGPASFTVYYGSYAESNWDFICLSSLDDSNGASWNNTNFSGTSVYTTSGSQSSAAPNLSRYYSTSASGTHYFYVMYKKDGTTDSNDDRGYLALPNSYSYVWK